jgi:hypothetical protein
VSEIRTERTHGLKDQLSSRGRAGLVSIRHSDGYEALLDLMEMCCVEQETRLINVEVENTEKVVAEHKMSKAFWQVFVGLQKKVEVEIALHLGLLEDQQQRKQAADEYDETQQLLRP